MTKLLVLTLCITLFSHCGNSRKSKWTDKDRDNAYKGCMLGRPEGFTGEQVKKRCSCYLEKVMALSPDPVKQGEIPMSEVRKLNDECTAEAKK